jgi:hypothetical protein
MSVIFHIILCLSCDAHIHCKDQNMDPLNSFTSVGRKFCWTRTPVYYGRNCFTKYTQSVVTSIICSEKFHNTKSQIEF